MKYEVYPLTAVDALARWDSGESVFTVELGGLGPGYEQCIHILVFEIIRDYKDKPLPIESEWQDWARDTINRLEARFGFSGAQVGAAKSYAYLTLKEGWKATCEKNRDRLIQVSRHFPVLEPTGVRR